MSDTKEYMVTVGGCKTFDLAAFGETVGCPYIQACQPSIGVASHLCYQGIFLSSSKHYNCDHRLPEYLAGFHNVIHKAHDLCRGKQSRRFSQGIGKEGAEGLERQHGGWAWL
jgi:hypothetical protein